MGLCVNYRQWLNEHLCQGCRLWQHMWLQWPQFVWHDSEGLRAWLSSARMRFFSKHMFLFASGYYYLQWNSYSSRGETAEGGVKSCKYPMISGEHYRAVAAHLCLACFGLPMSKKTSQKHVLIKWMGDRSGVLSFLNLVSFCPLDE